MAEIQDRHRRAASLYSSHGYDEPIVCTCSNCTRTAQAIADQEATFIAWLKDGAPRPGLGDGGSYEEDIDDTLDNMVAAVESGRVAAQYEQITDAPEAATTEDGS